jgi:polyisoprenoid-binding protein YceI
MKIAISVLVILLVGGAVFYAVQKKPDASLENAIVSDLVNMGAVNTDFGASDSEGKMIDNENVKISFKGFGPGKVHDGGFKNIDSKLAFYGGVIKGIVTIDMNSMFSDSDKLTDHLKNKDFFEVDVYPTAVLVVESVADSKLSGVMTIKGVSKNIIFGVNSSDIGYSAVFNLNMKDFGIDQAFANETVELNIVVPVK